ncbi:hypothetical protein AAC691_12815 [Nguyenibacter vanlangensis]|uniref:Uncharacterized protein n=1 Tax=Nguyenibacter vanlangensis TaxID=1216886 RepID=A0ABZ3D0C7_9PROT
MAVEKITGRRLGSSEIVEFGYDPEDTNSHGVSPADKEENLVSHHRRIAPEAIAVMAPPRGDAGGVFLRNSSQVTVFCEKFGRHAQSTLFHELWHYAENCLLSDADCEIVYAECRSRGDTWESAYLDSDVERAARAFQHYASARASGLQFRPAKRGTAQHIFERLYEGTEHRAIVTRRHQKMWGRIIDRAAPVVGMGTFVALMFIILPYLVTH